MDVEALLAHVDRLILKTRNPDTIKGAYPEVAQFLSTYAGANSEFLSSIRQYNPHNYNSKMAAESISNILVSFKEYVRVGLLEDISPTRKAQIDVVSDFLSQAQMLLESSGVHPAAPTVLIGACLEEFLRNWIEAAGLSLGNKKPSLDAYTKTLREQELITKQDVKDITSWSGLRNHAAHGEWDQVDDSKRVLLMLEGINLFMRKYVP